MTPGGALMAELSVLIVNYNTWGECAEAIRTLRSHGPTRADGSPMPFECIVVDNQSPQQPPLLIERVEQQLRLLGEEQGDPEAGRLIRHDENGGYSKGMNLAFRHSRGRWILVSNPDLVFGEGLISKLQRHLESDPGAGIVVPKGFWTDDFSGHLPPNTLPTLGNAWVEGFSHLSARSRRRHARRLVDTWIRVWQAEQPVALPMMSGCLFLIERGFFESIGRFDERYPLYYEDADLSVKIRKAGRTVCQVPDAKLVHYVNRSGMSDTGTMMSRHDASRVSYYRKWYGWLGEKWLALTHWLIRSPKLARWRGVEPEQPFTDLGEGSEPPVIELPRHCEQFLVLMSLDMRFFLAAGMFGSGDRWSPTPEAWRLFVHANFYFTVYDLTGGRREHLGVWRFQSMSHLGQPVPGAAPAAVEEQPT